LAAHLAISLFSSADTVPVDMVNISISGADRFMSSPSSTERIGLQLRLPALTGLADATKARRQKATRPRNAQLTGVKLQALP
jgi:hypothetical protein